MCFLLMTWQPVSIGSYTVQTEFAQLLLRTIIIMSYPLIILVCGFEAFINGKHIVGEVKEKEQAHKEYKQAISEGHGAYLMDEETPVISSYNKKSSDCLL